METESTVRAALKSWGTIGQIDSQITHHETSMLTIPGSKIDGFCDGVTRRQFLRIGGLAMGGLSLPALLQAGVTQEQIDQMMVENPKRFFGAP